MVAVAAGALIDEWRRAHPHHEATPERALSSSLRPTPGRPRALGLNRNSVATRLAQLAKSGELAKAERGYEAPKRS
jgi:hypothetical protein